MEPTNMPDQHSNSNSELSSRVHRVDNPAANEPMPKSIWQPGVVQRLGDYIKQLRQVDQQSDKSNVAGFTHKCPRHAERTCNCTSSCADDDAGSTEPRSSTAAKYTQYAADIYTCPISGSICLGIKCREWCESGVDRSKT